MQAAEAKKKAEASTDAMADGHDDRADGGDSSADSSSAVLEEKKELFLVVFQVGG